MDRQVPPRHAPQAGLSMIVDVPVAKFNAMAALRGVLIVSLMFLGVGIWLVVVAGALVGISMSRGVVPSLTAIFVASAAGIAVIWYFSKYRHYWVDRCTEGFRTGEIVAHLKFIAEHGRVDLHRTGPQGFTSQLVERGVVGYAIRIDAWRKLTPIKPLTRQFEPRLILEGTDDFEQFLREGDEAARSSHSSTTGHDDVDRRGTGRLRIAAARNLGLVFALGLLSVAGICYLLGGTYRIVSGFLAFFAIVVFGRIGAEFVARNGGKQWLAVPGGILIRQPRGLGTRSSLHLMKRSNSLILATRKPTEAFWRVTITDGNLSTERAMTNNELVVTLRAWASPLATPALERFSDWAGEA